MHIFLDIVAVLASTALASAVASHSSGRYIVELVESASSFGKRDVHAELFEQLDRRGVSWETGTKFESRLFNGVSITLESAEDIKSLHVMDVVKAIYPLRTYESPRTFNKRIITRDSKASDIPAREPRDSTHIMTGVDKLHAQGFKGKGVKIGVIDTGIDYTHPNLGGGIGEGKLVVGGYDFVGDDYDGTNTPVPDADPFDQCVGHGTHVAGIIAMQPGNEFGVSGVAYESTLMAYRVFGCTGIVSDEIIIAALLRAEADGCDVITLSIGGLDGWSTGPSSVVASRIAADGRVVTISAGNDGSDGAWNTMSPGNGLDVISVGSVDNTELFYNTLTVSGVEHEPMPYFLFSRDNGFAAPKLTGEWPLYALSMDLEIENDGCEPLPSSVPDLSKFIIIVRRGGCVIDTKVSNVAAKGGKAIIIANNGGIFESGSFDTTIPALMVDTADGDFFVNQIKANADIRVSFPQDGGIVTIPTTTGGLSSSFSTYGPTNDGYFKPAISAPGGNIMSTWPTALGSWMILSGTSMACPHVAGIAALLLQAKGKNAATTKSMRTLLQTTTTMISSSAAPGELPNTLAQTGAGLVNVYNALSYKTELSVGQLELNDTANWKADHTFQIKNTGSDTMSYRITHFLATTIQTMDPNFGLPIPFPLPVTPDKVGVKLSTESVVVQPGESTTVTVKFTPPAGVGAKTYPVLSGYIQVEGYSDTLKVAYIGIAGNLKDIAVFDGSDVFFGTRTPLLLDSQGNNLVPGTEFTLSNGNAPTVHFRLAFGTPRLVTDLVSKDLHTKVTIQPPTSLVKARADVTTFDSIPIVGRLKDDRYLARSPFNSKTGLIHTTLPSQFPNGTSIPPGEYRLLLRAQRVATDPTLESSYDVFMSNWFKVIEA